MALIGIAAVGIVVLVALIVAAIVGTVEDESTHGETLSDLTMTVFWTVLAAELLFAAGGFVAGVV